MTEEVARLCVDRLIAEASDSVDITFFGGEPLLNPKAMREIVRYGRQRCDEEKLGFTGLLITNGTICTDETMSVMKYAYEQLDQFAVQVTIDGIPKVQDVNRITVAGTGSSGMVEKFVKRLRVELPEKVITAHACISKFSLPHLYESYQYVRELGFPGMWTMPIHELDWTDEEVALYEKEMYKIKDHIVKDCVAENTTKYYNSCSSLTKCKTKFPDKPCGAGHSYCTFTAEGDIYPCHAFYSIGEDTKLGSVFEEADLSKRKIYNDYSFENIFGDMSCADCKNYSCYTCIAMNYKHNGNMMVGFPMYCKLSRIQTKIADELKQEMYEKGLIKDGNNSELMSIIKETNNSINDYKNTTMEVILELAGIVEAQHHEIEGLKGRIEEMTDIVEEILKEVVENEN